MSSLRDRFADGSVPEELDLVGRWAVRLVAASKLPQVRFLGHTKVVEKRDGVVAGHNEFLGAARTARFEVRRGRSGLDHDLEVVRISYDVAGNSALVRPLIDEVRRVADDQLLGRGVFRFPGGLRRNVFWFSMERE